MMERVEAPPIPDGYGLSLAFLAMLDVTRCVQVRCCSDPAQTTAVLIQLLGSL